VKSDPELILLWPLFAARARILTASLRFGYFVLGCVSGSRLGNLGFPAPFDSFLVNCIGDPTLESLSSKIEVLTAEEALLAVFLWNLGW
jgi:hypothetical protein